MMDIFQAVVLGIIQGMAEWLPVSSKAVVALVGTFAFGMDYQEALGTAIFLHTGTLLASAIYFREEIIRMMRSVFERNAERSLLIFLIITTLCTGVIAAPLLYLTLNMDVPESFFTIMIGVFLLVIAYLHKTRKELGQEQELTPKKALVTGLAQGLSGLPGVSRSGITVAALIMEGYPLGDAFRLSFLMSMPVVFGAEIVLPFLKSGYSVSVPLIAGAVAALLVSLFTIGRLLELAKEKGFYKVTLALGLIILSVGLMLLFR
jgi:undecaprenyl-diphosphatase